jgi:RIO-like serine/threonine protein kinase
VVVAQNRPIGIIITTNKQTNKQTQTNKDAIFAVFPHGYATPRPTQWLRLVVVANMLAYSATYRLHINGKKREKIIKQEEEEEAKKKKQ